MRTLLVFVIPLVFLVACSRDKGASTELSAADDPAGVAAGQAVDGQPTGSTAAAGQPPASDAGGGLGATASPGVTPAPPPSAEGPTPQSLYDECRERVEGQESDGECTTDADCARAGCGSEVCLPASLATDVMTTCEVKPCFSVLDTCGCVEGRCNWSLKTELSDSLRRHLQRAGSGPLGPRIIELPGTAPQ